MISQTLTLHIGGDQEDAASSPPLLFELDGFNGYKAILRVFYPGVMTSRVGGNDGPSLKLRAVVGELGSQYGRTVVEGLPDLIQFSNSTAGRTKYPVHSMGSYRIEDQAYDEDGRGISPNLAYNPDTGQIESDVPFTGWVTVESYSTAYSKVDYSPRLDPDGVRRYGWVLGFLGKTRASFQVPAPELMTQNGFEVYRVTSEMLVDTMSNSWEKPPGWPETRDYPYTNATAPDQDDAVIFKRTHELGEVNSSGYFSWRGFVHFNERPYSGGTTRPVYKLERKGRPSEDWAGAAYDALNWGEIEREIQRRWPGVTG